VALPPVADELLDEEESVGVESVVVDVAVVSVVVGVAVATPAVPAP
jgi:hypothetical protein